MSDGKKSCLGFIFLIGALVIAVSAVLVGGIGEAIKYLGGNTFGISLKSGLIIGVGALVFFFVLAVYMFITIRNYAWFPAIAAGVYTVLPDLIIGPEDDIVVLLLGGLISGLLAWRQSQGAGVEKLDAGEE
ncbi:MAG: hypothetical protein FVQ83_13995 [Chloroflexi bacterium]|nr:hypothetical protein [Chloroflexota bacterium]